MDSSAASPSSDTRLTKVWRVEFRAPEAAPERAKETSVAAEAAEQQASEAVAEQRAQLAPADLLIEVDRASGRFVNTLLDSDSKEVLRRYPSEAQLEFSRAIGAYMRAMSD